ncbi:MAG TPA: hypothetical protein VK809_04985, partial [Bacteroidia bacterium]|nr:hypothetical protein [Bacteroidia bacterium]
EQGPSGTNGTNGATNMKVYIDSIPASSVGWSADISGYYSPIAESAISVGDSDNVIVSVATSLEVNAVWYPLAYSNLLSTGDQMEYTYQRGGFTLYYTFATAPAQMIYVKIIVTPPSLINKKSGSSVGRAQN